MRITWHGHSFYHVETRDGTSILVDPYFENGKTRKRVREFHPDVVLLTHGHGDHTGSVLEYKDAHAVTNWEIGQWLRKNGMRTQTMMNVGGSTKPKPGLRLFMTPANHSSGLDAAPLANGTLAYGGSPCGFLVDDGETRLYVAGDTGLFGDMRAVIRDVLKPDVAILPIGDLFTMGPEHAAIAAEWLGVKVATPCHYGTFPPIEQDPQAFAKPLLGKVDVRVPRVDEGFEVAGGKVR